MASITTTQRPFGEIDKATATTSALKTVSKESKSYVHFVAGG